MRKVLIFCLFILSANPVLAERSQTAQIVYDILKQQYGKKTISGTMAKVDWNTTEAKYVYDWTGKWPAMNTFDFISIYGNWTDYSDMSTVDGWWNNGGLVGCMWHWMMLANNGSKHTYSPGTGDTETSFDCSKISDTSSEEYQQVISDIDKVAASLKAMKDLGIPVIWRPLHEASGNTCQYDGGKAWFWWGAKGAEAYKALWRLMFDRLVNYHGLDNLIWVWTSQVKDDNWYPGDEYVDIIARDAYGMSGDALYENYKNLTETYPDKIVTLAECGSSNGTPCATLTDMWQAGCRWGWMMPWYDTSYKGGDTHLQAGKSWWTDAMNSEIIIDHDDMVALKAEYINESEVSNMSMTNLDAGWNATYADNTITYTKDWGAKGWSNISIPAVDKGNVKLVIEFAELPTDRGTIEGDGIVNAVINTGQKRYVMTVTSESTNIGQVVIKAASAGTKYKLAKVYVTQWTYPTASAIDENLSLKTEYTYCYNLLGQMINENSKGLVITNGKKKFRK